MNRGSNILLNRDFVDKLRTMRKESIEVTQAVRIITDAAVSIIIRPMKHGIEMTGISQEDQWFYDHTVVDFCNEFVANIACYGLVVYAVVDGVPKVVDIRDVDITIYPHNEYEVRLRNRYAGRRRERRGAAQSPLTVFLGIRSTGTSISSCTNTQISPPGTAAAHSPAAAPNTLPAASSGATNSPSAPTTHSPST